MAGEPTLRHGDHEADGWVKYLQNQLIIKLLEQGIPFDSSSLAANGTFDDATLAAVRAFQHHYHLTFEDGVVGNETWAALTMQAHHAPGTDHQAAHTHHDHGAHVVWFDQADGDDGHWNADSDTVVWIASIVGDRAVANAAHNACVTVTKHDGTRYMEFMPLENFGSYTGQPGESMYVQWSGAKAELGAGTHQYVVELPSELGGQARHGQITIH